MKTRILTALVGIPLLLLVLFSFRTPFFNVIIAVVCVIAMHEALSAFKIKNGNFMYAAFLPITVALLFRDVPFIDGLIFPLATLSMILFVAFIIFNFKDINIANVCGAFVLSGITLMCFYSVAAFKYLMPFEKYGYDGVFVIMIIFAFAWGGDGIAYFAGRKFGKHKLSPSISPNKTVEGAVGAVFGSMIIGVLITVVCTYIKPILEGLPQARQLGIGVYLAIIPLGAICAVLGMAGDLFASSIKRQMEIKDYGNIFPGHGGILDRFDSLILITPFILSVLYIVKMFGVNL